MCSLEKALRAQSAGAVSRGGGQIEFRVGHWISRWSQLAAASRGKLVVERDGERLSIRYRLEFTELVVFATLVTGLVWMLLLGATPGLTVGAKAMLLGFEWIGLVGGNIAVTAVRFPRFLRRATALAVEVVEA